MSQKKIAIINMSNTFRVNLPGIEYVSVFKSLSPIERFLVLCRCKKMLVESDGWTEQVKKADIVIMFDSVSCYASLCQKVESVVDPHVKLIFYAWNPLTYSEDYKLLSQRWHKTSFSLEDSYTNGFQYMGTFYHPLENYESKSIQYDGFFIGIPKGREQKICEIKKMFRKYHLKVLVKLVDNVRALYDFRYSPRLSYNKVIEYCLKSRSIVEVLEKGQSGPSLRSMEALFMCKKLITTNEKIVDYDFYHPDNVFIYGLDNNAEIKFFLEKPYHSINKEIVEQYCFSNWLKRICGI